MKIDFLVKRINVKIARTIAGAKPHASGIVEFTSGDSRVANKDHQTSVTSDIRDQPSVFTRGNPNVSL